MKTLVILSTVQMTNALYEQFVSGGRRIGIDGPIAFWNDRPISVVAGGILEENQDLQDILERFRSP